jgi:DoxX-like family
LSVYSKQLTIDTLKTTQRFTTLFLNFKQSEKMKKETIIYWVTTGLVSAMMLFSGFMYFTNPEMAAQFAKTGFPDFFRVELGAAKILGAAALLIPMVPSGVKNFAYAGFAIVLGSAAFTHFSIGDPMSAVITPLVVLGILGVSYVYSGKLATA